MMDDHPERGHGYILRMRTSNSVRVFQELNDLRRVALSQVIGIEDSRLNAFAASTTASGVIVLGMFIGGKAT